MANSPATPAAFIIVLLLVRLRLQTARSSRRALLTYRQRQATGSRNFARAGAKVHYHSMFEWDDVKYLLAVARHGSTLAAANALKLSQSTVKRRIAELERSLGCELVKRHATGYRLTEFGGELLPYAEQIERAARAFEQRKATIDRGEAGLIRVTCPEPIVYRIMKSALLDRFHARHPTLRVEFVMSDQYIDLARGDADVALRSGDVDDDVLVGRRIADSLWSVYAARSYIKRNGRPGSIADLARPRVHRLRRANGVKPRRQVAAGGRTDRSGRRPGHQRAWPRLSCQVGSRRRAYANRPRRCGIRTGAPVRTGARADAKLAYSRPPRPTTDAGCCRLL